MRRPAQVDGTNAAALEALRGLFTDPGDYYVNIHTTDFPGGIMRGQLQPAIGTVLMGVMSSDNEVPPQTPAASGTAVVVAMATLDAKGDLATGVTYQSADLQDHRFREFHRLPHSSWNRRQQRPGVAQHRNPQHHAARPERLRNVGPFYTEVDLTNAVQVSTFIKLFRTRARTTSTYTQLHTAAARCARNCGRRTA